MKLIFLTILFFSSLFSETTLCYKNNIQTKQLDNAISLDGKKCKNKLTANDMIKQGWKVTDSNVLKSANGYNHIYVFTKDDTKIQEINLDSIISKSTITNSIQSSSNSQIDLSVQQLIIYDLFKNKAKILIGNLKIGQSGVVLRTNKKEDSIIIANAQVIESNPQYSLLKLKQTSAIRQDAIPTSRYKAQNGDTFILNHIYKTSILIVPNRIAKQKVESKYKQQRFLNEDFFASYLKTISSPIPTKKNIMRFAKSQQIGTVFVVIANNLYIVDAISFKVIDRVSLQINDNTTQSPFYTKITGIKKGLLSFGADEISNYNKYYLQLLGIK